MNWRESGRGWPPPLTPSPTVELCRIEEETEAEGGEIRESMGKEGEKMNPAVEKGKNRNQRGKGSFGAKW